MRGGKTLPRLGVCLLGVLLIPECNCPPCDPSLDLRLPSLGYNHADILVEFRHEPYGPPLIQCRTLLRSSGVIPVWACETSAGTEQPYWSIRGVEAAGDWYIRVVDPRGARELSRSSEWDGPSEAWPFQCVCDWYVLYLSYHDLGLPPPDFTGPGSGGAAGVGGSAAGGTGGMPGAGGAPLGGAAGAAMSGAAGEAPEAFGGTGS